MKSFYPVALIFLLLNALILVVGNIASQGQYFLYFSSKGGSLVLPFFLIFLLGFLSGILLVLWYGNREKSATRQSDINTDEFEI